MNLLSIFLYRNGLVLVTEIGGRFREIKPYQLSQDIDTLSLVAASNFVSMAANAARHLSKHSSEFIVHLYSGMFRENQPAALQAFCGVLPENSQVYLDNIPDSAGVAVINSCIEDGEQINPHQFVKIIPLLSENYPRNRFTSYLRRWYQANQEFQSAC